MSKEFNIEKIQQQRNQDRIHFLSQKINLEQKMDSLIKWEQDFNFQLWMKERSITDKKVLHQYLFEAKDADISEMPCCEVALWVRSIRPSYIAPAHNYNKYIDTLVQDIYWDDIKNEIETSSLKLTEYVNRYYGFYEEVLKRITKHDFPKIENN